MNENEIDFRTHRYNRLARRAVVGCVLSFASLFVPVLLPVENRVGMLIGVVAVLALILSGIVLIYAALVRDLLVWRQNRWRFGLGKLFSVTTAVALPVGFFIALQRGASGLQLLLAVSVILVVSIPTSTIISNRARIRHFRDMAAQGRYLEWSAVAEHLESGNGTALVGPCYNVSTVWWTDREVTSVDDAKTAVNTCAFITVSPKQLRIARWLRARFPNAAVVELPTFFGL